MVLAQHIYYASYIEEQHQEIIHLEKTLENNKIKLDNLNKIDHAYENVYDRLTKFSDTLGIKDEIIVSPKSPDKVNYNTSVSPIKEEVKTDSLKKEKDTIVNSEKFNDSVKSLVSNEKQEVQENTIKSRKDKINDSIKKLTTKEKENLIRKVKPSTFLGIVKVHNKRRNNNFIKPNDSHIWIELKSNQFGLENIMHEKIRGGITINGTYVEISDVESKHNRHRLNPFNDYISYFLKIKIRRNILFEGKNEIVVIADEVHRINIIVANRFKR